MSVVTALVAGAVVGVRHSFEADHIAAIATLVDGEEGSGRPSIVGTTWGIGHALPILLVGAAFLLVRAQVPDSVTTLFGALAGVILVFLGIRTLVNVVRVTEHAHGGSTHSHVHVGPFSVGTTHTHRYGESLLVGLVHGLAGSGLLIVLLSASAPSVAASLTLLSAFAVASVLTMATLSVIWDRVLGTGLQRRLQIGAGVASLGIGVLLIADELFGLGVGHEHDGHGHSHEHALALVEVGADQLAPVTDLAIAVF